MSTAAEQKQAPRAWRIAANIWLDRINPREGEIERWETGICGPHPCHVQLVRFTSGQWGASLDNRGMAYQRRPLDALIEAQVKAADSLRYSLHRVLHTYFEESWCDTHDR